MQPQRKNSFVRQVAKPVLAGLLALSFLFLTTLAASPSLHHSIHPDASSPTHSCVIGLLAKGHLHSAPAVLTAPHGQSLFGGVLLLQESAAVPSADYRFSSSRAPPCLA